MELLGWLIHQLFGSKESAKPSSTSYVSADGKEKVFDNHEELEAYEHEEAIKNAKYIYRDDPDFDVLTWSGRGRQPKWVERYLESGGDLKDLEKKIN